MIAVVEKSERAVWGVGGNADLARLDAERWMAEKPQIKVGKLECVPIDPAAPFDVAGGEELFEYCMFDKQPDATQLDLF